MQPPTISFFSKTARIWGICTILVVVLAIKSNFQNGNQFDFVSFWAAAKLALSGNFAGIYDIEQHHAVQMTAINLDGKFPFPYPPPYILAVLPFGLLSYPMAHAVWVIVTGAAYVTAARKLVPASGWLAVAFPPVMICGVIGQNSFLAAAIFMLALACLGRTPFVAGMVFGLLIFKPHLGVLIPIALIAGREWRTFAGATVTTLGLVLISLIFFGWASWAGFFAMLPLFGSIAAEGLVGWNKMASVYAALRLIGVPEIIAWFAHIAVAIAGIMVLWRTWSATKDIGPRTVTLIGATLLISPYIYVYDQVVLFAAMAMLWQRGIGQRWMFAMFALAFISILGSFVPNIMVTPAPLVTIVALVLVMRLGQLDRLSGPHLAHQHRHDQQTAQNY